MRDLVGTNRVQKLKWTFKIGIRNRLVMEEERERAIMHTGHLVMEHLNLVRRKRAASRIAVVTCRLLQ